MPTPITSGSPALAALVIKHGANSVFVQRIIQVVNASSYVNQLFNEFEARTLPDGTKPLLFNSGVGGTADDPGPVLKDTNATDRRITISDDYLKSYADPNLQRVWELELTKTLAHEIQHSNTYVARRTAETTAISQPGTATALAQRLADMRTNDELASKITEFNALQSKGGVTANEMYERLRGVDGIGSVIDFHSVKLGNWEIGKLGEIGGQKLGVRSCIATFSTTK